MVFKIEKLSFPDICPAQAKLFERDTRWLFLVALQFSLRGQASVG